MVGAWMAFRGFKFYLEKRKNGQGNMSKTTLIGLFGAVLAGLYQ